MIIPFTPAQVRFWEVLNQAEEVFALPPDEPDVNFTPRRAWRCDLWSAALAMTRQDDKADDELLDGMLGHLVPGESAFD